MVSWRIEKDVPAPEPAKSATTYPWSSLDVGDCLIVDVQTWQEVDNVRSSAHQWAYRHPPVKFTCRKCPEGIKVWRLS